MDVFELIEAAGWVEVLTQYATYLDGELEGMTNTGKAVPDNVEDALSLIILAIEKLKQGGI